MFSGRREADVRKTDIPIWQLTSDALWANRSERRFLFLLSLPHTTSQNAMSDAEKPTTTPAADSKATGIAEADLTKYKVRSLSI